MFDKKKWQKQYYKNNCEKAKEYSKQYRKDNPEKVNELQREYYKNNPEKVKEWNEKWRKNNPEKKNEQTRRYCKKYPERVKERSKEYYIRNREKVLKRNEKYRKNNPEKTKKYRSRYKKIKRKTDLKYNLNHRISNAIRKSLKGNKAGRKWELLVGYTVNDLIKRLKKTMPKGYNWNNYLEGKLEIDHIIPLSIFNYDKPRHTDFQNCWSLKNLRLLPARENLIKHNELSKPFQPALKI